MSNDEIVARDRRQALKAQYNALFRDFSEILFRLDPMAINFDVNSDEYEPEARTIVPRVMNATSVEEIVPIVRDELWKWFGSGIARPEVTYEQIADELFRAVTRRRM